MLATAVGLLQVFAAGTPEPMGWEALPLSDRDHHEAGFSNLWWQVFNEDGKVYAKLDRPTGPRPQFEIPPVEP